jgi:hypothetical protein
MANKDDSVDSTKVHGPRNIRTYSSPMAASCAPTVFVPEQRFVTNAFTLPHVIDGDAQVDGFVDEHELTQLLKSTQSSLGNASVIPVSRREFNLMGCPRRGMPR